MSPGIEIPVLPGFPPGRAVKAASELLTSIKTGVFSHPGKPLIQHLIGVGANCAWVVEELGIPVNLSELMLAALTHDLGKIAPQFQAHLAGKGKGVNHAFPSAWFTLLLARESGLSYREAIWLAEIVRRHHTGLVDFTEIGAAWNSDDLDGQSQSAMLHALLPEYTPALLDKDFDDLKDVFFELEDDLNPETWLKVRLTYSVLIAADRMDAIGMNERSKTNFPVFKEPVFSPSPQEVGQWRKEVQQECLHNAMDMVQCPGVYSLTLPTGAGKTITGIRIANALIQKYHYKRLIYALPFISIVEQTTAISREIYGTSAIQEDHSQRQSDSDDDVDPWRRMADLFRYWHAPVVLTTMVQLWNSIFAPQANLTMNFHRLSKAIIILDEPQTISPNFWYSFGKLLDYLSRELGSVFILMTATQPHILGEQNQRAELAPKRYQFPKIRHHYTAWKIDQEFTIEETLQIIDENRLLDKKTGLLVFNTKGSALAGYDLLQSQLPPSFVMKFLSAWLTPWRRKIVLDKLKAAEASGEKYIMVSTQVVEAGVDLDFEWVFRDLGPLDSIIQVAGRCNRHHRREEPGQVFVARLYGVYNGRHKSFAEMIYDCILLDATRGLLMEHSEFDESSVPEIIERYYRAITSRMTPVNLFGDLAQGQWGEVRVLYEEQRFAQIPIIIEENEHVRPLVEQLECGFWTLENRDEKKRLMQELQRYTIEIPEKMLDAVKIKCGQIPHSEAIIKEVFGGAMYYLTLDGIGEEPQHIYHPVKGFIPPQDQGNALIF